MGCFGSKETTSNTTVSKGKSVEKENDPTPSTVEIRTSSPTSVNNGGPKSDEMPDRSDRPVEEFYDLKEELGKGGFSIVRRAVNKSTGQSVAIKFIDKKMIGNKEELELIQREIDIMKKVRHPNVLRLIERFETPEGLAVVMELVTGGELFYKIVDNGSYSERDARNIVRQLVQGVDYLHGMGIAHRDLKPENLLCTDGEPGVDMIIKIADFGLSKVFSDGSVLETSCGTPDYAAPEVLRMEGTYDNQVDCWSIGVITYVLLCGFPPFYGKTQNILFDKILRADYDFPEPEWLNVSASAKDFIKKLLVIEPAQRFTAKQCLEHAWLKTEEVGDDDVIQVGKIKKYYENRKGEHPN